MKFRLSAFLARHRPKQKRLNITWKKVKFLCWEIPWIDKAYVFGKRFHHLELGLILIFVGWILVIHDWFVHERPKVSAVSIGFEAEKTIRHEDGSIELKDAGIRRVRPVRVPKPGSKIGKLKSRFFKPRPPFEKRHWRKDARPEED